MSSNHITRRVTALHFQVDNVDFLCISDNDQPELKPVTFMKHMSEVEWETSAIMRGWDVQHIQHSVENRRTKKGGLVEHHTNVVTFANGHEVEFGAISRGYCRQKRAKRPFAQANHDLCCNLINGLWSNEPHATNTAPAQQRAVKQNKRSNEMNTSEMITLLQLEGGAKVVRAQYVDGPATPNVASPVRRADGNKWDELDDTGYCFKNVIGLHLEKGDMIAVETRDTYALVRVVNPDVMVTEMGCAMDDLKHVVAKLRNSDYLKAKEAEHNAFRQLSLSEATSKLTKYREQLGNDSFNAVSGMLGITATGGIARTGQDTVDGEVLEGEVPPAYPGA